MSTPTEKPVDRVSVSLSDADFKRILGEAMREVLNSGEYGAGRIEVTEITPLLDDERDGWIINTLFIPSDAS